MDEQRPGWREDTFDTFCAREYTQLVQATSLLVGDRGVAEELVQTALERAWLRWDRVNAMASPGGWVQRVAFNLARSTFRRRGAERRALRRHGVTEAAQPVDTPTVLAVREALQQLPTRQREVVLHRFHAGRSVAETAAVMGLSQPATTQLTHRARTRLRTLLDEQGAVRGDDEDWWDGHPAPGPAAAPATEPTAGVEVDRG